MRDVKDVFPAVPGRGTFGAEWERSQGPGPVRTPVRPRKVMPMRFRPALAAAAGVLAAAAAAPPAPPA
ncbi:hypothetical protein, partial [Actinomadura keratinilytica]|uniref:hypothetical protein n=1 Tax=Actinomadura keratinilytica TaxID=547461 RepID=UPI0031F08EA6